MANMTQDRMQNDSQIITTRKNMTVLDVTNDL